MQQRKSDRLKDMKVESLVETIFGHIHSYEDKHFFTLWDFLNMRFFSSIDIRYSEDIERFYNSLMKYYLVNAIKKGQPSHALSFLQNHSSDLLLAYTAQEEEWRPWYSLPYISHPESK